MNIYHTLIVSISFLSLLFIHPHVCIEIASKNITGFSFKLIHRDSPESPLYPGRELTFPEKWSRYSKATDARAWYLSTKAGATRNFTSNDDEPIVGRGVISLDTLYYYMVNVNIGFPEVNLMLLLDTGSDLIWTQCLPCENCFRQQGPIYDSRQSSDFKLLPCSNDLCRNNDKIKCGPDNKCHYDVQYGGGSRTRGVAMQETFRFPPNPRAVVFEDLVMGCSNNNQGFLFEQSYKIGGILGMSSSPHSFPNQLSWAGANLFSYCLPSTENKNTYLRFGADIVYNPSSQFQTVGFVPYRDAYYYGFELEDISIAGKRINFPPGTFAQRRYGAGGCFIDSAAPLGMIDQLPFNIFIAEYEKFYLPTKLVRNTRDCPDPRQYCYYSNGIETSQHPYVGFHFKEGAIYYMAPRNLIYLYQSFFSLMIKPGDRTIIGAWQQRGVRLLYDLRPDANQLSFAFEDCSREEEH